MKNLKFYALILGASVVLSLSGLTGCKTSESDDGRSSGRVVDDEKLTDQVEERLQREPVFKYTDVDVRTFNGVVQLSGFVTSEEQKQRAGELAAQTPGVAQVVNNISLKVTPPASPTGRP
jgi:hyperosmotically inducible protein